MFYAKKTEIMFFHEIRPDGHDLASQKLKYRLCVRFDPAAMILPEKKSEITFFREN
jgi:hypothetical protein